MKRTQIAQDGKLRVNWAEDEAVERMDPYLVWASITAWKGIKTDFEGDIKAVQIMLELEEKRVGAETVFGDGLPAEIARSIQPVYYAASGRLKSKYCHATVCSNSLPYLFDSGNPNHLATGISRLELGMAVESADGNVTSVSTPSSGVVRSHVLPCLASSPLGSDVMAVIDFGCPFAHAHFKGRIGYFWNQDPTSDLCKRGSADVLFKGSRVRTVGDFWSFWWLVRQRGGQDL